MNRAFVFSGMVFLLTIPAFILAASFLVMLDTGSEGVYVHVRGEKTFSIFETAETDLDRAMDIAGRRAVIAAADYILAYGECLNSASYDNSTYGTGAVGAVKELMITGRISSKYHGTFLSNVTGGSTLDGWTGAFKEKAEPLGFTTNLIISPDDLYITSVNDTWFYAILRINASMDDHVMGFAYNGSLPRGGNTTRLISGSGINVSIFGCSAPAINQAPNSTITSPANGSAISCNETLITGSATDDSSVSRVDLNISGTWYSPTLSDPGASSTNWNYSWTPAANGNYTVCSHAVDNNYTGQSPDYCIDTTVSGCSVSTCNIVLDPSYTPRAVPTMGPSWQRYYQARFRVLNNDPSSSVTIDNMTVDWSKTGVGMDRIRFGSWGGTTVWSGCAVNDTSVDISPDQGLSAGSTSIITLRFRDDPGCASFTYPDMRSTYFTVAFDTDQGVCNVDFNV